VLTAVYGDAAINPEAESTTYRDSLLLKKVLYGRLQGNRKLSNPPAPQDIIDRDVETGVDLSWVPPQSYAKLWRC
jgi:hypothetical protein